MDPVLQTLEAFKLGVWRGTAVVRVEPLDAFELELSALWSK